MALVFTNKIYDESFTFTRGDAWGNGATNTSKITLNNAQESCMRWVLYGMHGNVEAQYLGSCAVYVVDFFKGRKGNVIIEPNMISDITLREKFVEFFGDNLSIVVTLQALSSSYVILWNNAYGGNAVPFSDTYDFKVSDDPKDKFLYISPLAYRILKAGSNNINENYVSKNGFLTPKVQYQNYYAWTESSGILSQITRSNSYDYRSSDINYDNAVSFFIEFLKMNETEMRELNYYDIEKTLKKIEYDVTIDGNSSFFKGDVTINERMTFENKYDDDLKISYLLTIPNSTDLQPFPNGIKLGNETIYRFWVSAIDKLKNNMNSPIGSEMLLELFDQGVYPKTYNFHSFPLYSIIQNSKIYNDYINDYIKGNVYYVVWMQSYKRHWDVEWDFAETPISTEWIPINVYTDTLNGITYSGFYDLTDSIMFDIGIPLSNTNFNDLIDTHVVNGVVEKLNIKYIPLKNTYDDDINNTDYYVGTPTENQDPTPTEPEFKTDKPTVVTPTNKPDYPDKPVGSIVDPMKPQAITPSVNPVSYSQGLYTIYKLNLLDVAQIGAFLWGSNWYENLKLINNTPLENVLSLKIAPFDFESSKTSQVYIGNVPVQVGETAVNGDVIDRNLILNIGTFTILPKYNSFLDLQPFTNIQLYLPFVGYVQLDNNIVLNMECTLTAYIDVLTLMGKYQITRSDNVIVGEWEFNSAIELPLSATNKAQADFSKLTTLGKTLGNVVGDVLSMDVGGGVSDAVNGITSALATQYHTTTSGNLTSNLSLMTSRQCYIQITRPMWQDIQLFNHTYGRICNQTLQIGTLKGYTKILDIDLTGISATKEEKDMIKSIMADGFYA